MHISTVLAELGPIGWKKPSGTKFNRYETPIFRTWLSRSISAAGGSFGQCGSPLCAWRLLIVYPSMVYQNKVGFSDRAAPEWKNTGIRLRTDISILNCPVISRVFVWIRTSCCALHVYNAISKSGAPAGRRTGRTSCGTCVHYGTSKILSLGPSVLSVHVSCRIRDILKGSLSLSLGRPAWLYAIHMNDVYICTL